VLKIVRKIDDIFFQQALQKRRRRRKELKFFSSLEKDLDYKIFSFYAKNLNSELSSLCDVYGSDKGELSKTDHPYPWPSHTYADYYSRLFSHCRNSIKNIFECGLGTNNPNFISSMGISGKPGASLRVWRDFFPNAMVFGADIDKDILFEEERIKTLYMDQLNPLSIKSFWDAIEVNEFDIMVDDGLHTFEAGSTLFTNSIFKLSHNGVYIIEDVVTSDMFRYKNFFANKNYIVEYIWLSRPDFALDDNCLVVIRKQA